MQEVMRKGGRLRVAERRRFALGLAVTLGVALTVTASCRRDDSAAEPIGEAKPNMADKPLVLFLCTGNSCRSQMAEGWARHLKGDVLEARSAGVAPSTLNPDAVRVMAEAGVDISGHRSKHLDELKGQRIDYVVTVCDHAHETCPVLPRHTQVIHRAFEDPPHTAADVTDEEERLAIYRRVRDEIRAFVETLPGVLASEAKPNDG
jgi:arsenate reductase (thioredoxin)